MRALIIGLLLAVATATSANGETVEWTNVPNSSDSKASPLQKELAACWSIPAGVENAEDLIVKVVIVIGNDGLPTQVGIVDPKKTKIGRTVAKSAVEAVEKCSHNLKLKPGEYRVTFDPSMMF